MMDFCFVHNGCFWSFIDVGFSSIHFVFWRILWPSVVGFCYTVSETDFDLNEADSVKLIVVVVLVDVLVVVYMSRSNCCC